VDALLFPNRVEKTPRGTDCLVFVAGVNDCGIALGSAVPEPCRSWFERGATFCGSSGEGAGEGTRSSWEFAGDSGIVGFTVW
jgi:hypothetical protein